LGLPQTLLYVYMLDYKKL